MQRIATWRRQFNWRMLLMRIVINALALLITAGLVPNIYFIDRTVTTWLLLAVFLGILNAFVKPIIQFLTLRFIFATYGLVLVLINGILLLLLEFLFPTRFYIEGIFFWPLVGGAVIGIVSAFLESLLGLSPPIVSEKYPEVRQRIKDRETSSMQAVITEAAVQKTVEPKQAEQPPSSPAQDAAAVLAVLATNGETAAAPPADEVAAAPAEPVQTEQEA
ncbi:MAG TPA: phage holin family protein [Anaerolineae bacterium]|nr:phage holin family protein [Anaerolineae bacterium]